MADQKKTETAPAAPAPAKSALDIARERAKPVAKFTSNWLGMSPNQIDPAAVDGELHQVDIDDVLDISVIVYGYSERDGDKGKFAVVLCTRVTGNDLFVVVTGGSVVLKKLAKCHEKSGYPVSGTFKKCIGKQFAYYDFV